MRWPMSGNGSVVLWVVALLMFSAGCEMTVGQDPVDRSAEDACMEEGFDIGTTEYDNCVEELSEPDQ